MGAEHGQPSAKTRICRRCAAAVSAAAGVGWLWCVLTGERQTTGQLVQHNAGLTLVGGIFGLRVITLHPSSCQASKAFVLGKAFATKSVGSHLACCTDYLIVCCAIVYFDFTSGTLCGQD
jgi:hypothetical protein